MGAEVLALGLLAFLLTYWLHSTVLLGLAWLVTRRLPASSASLREGIWRVALFGGFITAGVQTGLGVEPPLGRWVLRPAVAVESAVAVEQVETARRIETAAPVAPDVIGTGILGPGAALTLQETPSRGLREPREHVQALVGVAEPARMNLALGQHVPTPWRASGSW